jgi:hypothetical protein
MSENESIKLTPTENEIFAKKFQAINDLYLSAKQLKVAYYKHARPEWSDEKIKKTVNDWMLFGGSIVDAE